MSLVLESVLAKIHPTLLCMVTISFAFRTDVCTGENEEFSLCSWRCPPTCVTMRLMISHPEILCPYRWQCRVGCRCSAGFIWDEHSKRCVRNIECPEYDYCPKGHELGIDLQCVKRRNDNSIISEVRHWADYPGMDTPWPHYYTTRKKDTTPSPILIQAESSKKTEDDEDDIDKGNEENYNDYQNIAQLAEYNQEENNPKEYVKLVNNKMMSKTQMKNLAKNEVLIRLNNQKTDAILRSKWKPRKHKIKLTRVTKRTTQSVRYTRVTVNMSDTKWKPKKKKIHTMKANMGTPQTEKESTVSIKKAPTKIKTKMTTKEEEKFTTYTKKSSDIEHSKLKLTTVPDVRNPHKKWKPTTKKIIKLKTYATTTKKENSIEYIIQSPGIDTKWKPGKKRKRHNPVQKSVY